MSIEDKILYAIVNKDTGEGWGNDTYSSPTGCKTSWLHGNQYWNTTIKFDEQDEYKIVKVKLVIVDE